MIYPQDAYLPHEAEIIEFIQDAPDIFTLRLQFVDEDLRKTYQFQPGQFNMLYLYGVGEVAISIVNDRDFKTDVFEHTIQVVGRVTKGMAKLKAGERIGVRGPYGSSWPVEQAKGKDVVIMTGGLGNAPLVAATEEILKDRNAYGKVYVVQGIRHSDGLIYQDKYTRWNNQPNTEVLLVATEGEAHGPWKWYKGFVTAAVEDLNLDYKNTYVMSVGPEIMMKNVAKSFADVGVPEEQIFVSLERSMKCAIGHCGHCQMGKEFVCKDGAVYAYPAVKELLSIKGV
ncbi:FAD/NAD(P)-binding protein [Francisella frigiditurris]|uniref:Oxidoreductase NAD-binding domain protein n=1 Tax=Francisella frigiditurris TaxID=1542390 RepID=A0A1J0KV97_9GAMM|nr:FAD/NAD(P)-binding protein [Francisella frigiditurris]APC97602.1 oxidoreductase NAD-binding domain protein [Francisella frigiditurris]